MTEAPVSLPVNMSYDEFLFTLEDEDCVNGTFLVRDGNKIVAAKVNMFEDLGKGFYDSGAWRTALVYICAADMSGVRLRGKGRNEQYAAGVNLSAADLRYADISNTILQDTIQVDGLSYQLNADLTGVIYNNFTIWPTGFVPPPSLEEESATEDS